MTKRKRYWLIAEAVLILLIVGMLTSAVTYSALQSQPAVLSGNTINSATASLLVSTDNSTFNNTKTGYTFNGVVPGGSPVPALGYSVYLKNTGTSNLSTKVSISTSPSNLSNVDLTKVFLQISRSDNSISQNFSLKTLIDSYASGGTALGDTVSSSTTAQYLLRASMSADAFSSTNGISISGIDIVFSGTAN